jgi:hypothetical protein
MSNSTIYWRGWTENQLAAYQQNQGNTNHCAKYAAASALNLLYGSSISGEFLVTWLNSRLLKGTFRYTIAGNQHGSFVFQTANLVRRLAQRTNLNPAVRSGIGTIKSLIKSLQDGNSITVVSVTYFKGQENLLLLMVTRQHHPYPPQGG